MQEELVFSKLFDAKIREIRSWNCISFPDSTDVQCSKVNFKTEVCSNSRCPTIAMLWIKEVEVAKSVDDLMTSQSIEGRFFLVFEMLDAKIASALKRIISSQHFRKELVSKSRLLENTTDFSGGRQIAYIIYDHFRATGAHDAALDLIRSIQCFITRR